MKIKTNLWSGVLFLILGVAALIVIPTQIPAGKNAYGPRLFPYIVSGIMIASSLGLLAGELWRGKLGDKKDLEKEKKPASDLGDITVLDTFEIKRAGLMFLIMTAYIFLIEPLGFVISSLFFVWGILAFFKSRKWSYYVVCGGLVVLIYYGFRIFLKVYLP
ncbi:MAG: tripartite tricarboxylate transporter TctB family protein [Lachnospiraceae bacterium]|nr:tripartite tricarboxylate transporter TctB family protein [Lachnospiraceae bacterium]